MFMDLPFRSLKMKKAKHSNWSGFFLNHIPEKINLGAKRIIGTAGAVSATFP